MFMLIWLFFSFCYAQERKVVVYPVAPNCHSLDGESGKENLTLDEALRNITSNTELYLLPGCHYVEEYNLVQNRSNISLIGAIQNNVTITCAKGLGLAFLNVFGLTITNVTIQSCGLNGSDLLAFRNAVRFDIDFFFELYADYHIALLCGNCGDLTMSSSTVTNTTGLGMLAINAIGTASITDVEFSFNYPLNCYSQSEVNITEKSNVGGGAMFIYHDYLPDTQSEHKQVILDINHSDFLGNFYCGLAVVTEIFYQYKDDNRTINYTLGAGGGLSIVVTQLNYTVDATVESCSFQNNTAKFGGGAHVQMFAGVSNSSATFNNCTFQKNGLLDFENSDITSRHYTSASALAVLDDLIRPSNAVPAHYGTPVKSNTITIFGCHFEANRAIIGGAMTVYSIYASPPQGGHLMLFIDDCTIKNNTALVGAGMYMVERKSSGAQPGVEITMRDTSVVENEVFKPVGFSVQSPAEVSSIIDAHSVKFTVTGNSTLSNNKGTAIRCVSSFLYLEGNVKFESNAGLLGGALQMVTASLLIVRNNTHVIFHNNSGSISGGAIYVDYISSLTSVTFQYEDCFLYFGNVDFLCIGRTFCPDFTELNFSLDFSGNTAPYGSFVYGSTLETCFWGITLKEQHRDKNLTLFELLYDLFPEKFNFGSAPNDTKHVSTPSAEVAILDYNSSYSVLPGESFNISVVGLDRFRRIISVVLTSQTNDVTSSHSVLGLSGYLLTTEQNNTKALVTVYGKEQQQDINVTLFTAFTYARAQITVNLMNCTLGFVYSNMYGSCKCAYELKYSSVDCNEQNKDLSVPNEVWVGRGPDEELVVEGCLQDYCRRGQKIVKPPDFDSQCHPEYNRTGLLCGKCKPGYSIGFGGSSCYKCGNSSLVWIFFFALAGVGIVLAISFVRLTVSDGYLNGIILFANIVSLYVHIFAVGSRITQLFVVIAWLNLDLGIDTCFFDGMNALAKVGLQFAFPLYLYILMGIITLIAKKSHRFAMRFNRSGFSAAKLFATLMLMSYTSLLETCAEALGVVKVDTISGTYSIRWRIDPNQEYFSGGHIPLAIVAVLVLVFYIIPAPFVLIFPSLAFKLGPMQKLKPIYDAFWAPFKPRYRFWVGLRLILRVIPFLCVAAIRHPLNILLLGMFLVALLYVQAIVMPFEGAIKNASDNFFLSILLIIVMGSLYFTIDTYQDDGYHTEQKTQYTFFVVIILLAYIVIAIIFIWHVMLRFPSLRSRLKNLLNRCRTRSKTSVVYRHLPTSTENYGATNQSNANSSLTGDRPDNEPASEEGSKQQVFFSELREPLLEDEGSLDLDTMVQVQSVQ